jgi:CSLREA domain-containing protein
MLHMWATVKAVKGTRSTFAVVLAVCLTMGVGAASADSVPQQSDYLSEYVGLGSASAPTWVGSADAPEVTSYVVNTTDDTEDGTCDFAHCSLRDALEAAAYEQGPHVITFEIPASDPGYDPSTGVWTIQPTTGYNLPLDVTIDGYVGSAPEAGARSVRPGIEIDGTTLAPLGITGLTAHDGGIVRGLIVNRFQYGIWVLGSDVTVEGCYVGTDPTGTQAKPNTLTGILIGNGASNAIIENNLLSGNSGPAIRVFGETTTGNTVRNNYVGVCLDGSTPLPNGGNGIYFHVGTHDNTVGPGNLIYYNSHPGVRVDGQGTRGNTITRNQIHGNGVRGILLHDGGNDELAPPVITVATCSSASGTACPDCVVEIFSDTWDQAAFYEGTATADSGGNWAFTAQTKMRGPYLTATATDGQGNTSELSASYSLLSHHVRLPLVIRGW